MKDIVDRFIAKDADGKLFTVMCIKEYRETNNSGAAIDEIGTSFQTTSGELLTTSNNFSFQITNTNRLLSRVGVERTAQGVLRACAQR
ncbi:MAG: hypothetical protein V4628_18025 [Pseudomonadota bacterium]